MRLRLLLAGDDKLAAELRRLNHVRFDAVVQKSMTQIYTRGKSPGGTPVDTGELKGSLAKSGDVVGYSKSYAPHVEYGHRTRGNGFVQGQKYLYGNVETQRPIFRRDLVKQLKKG